MTAFNGADFQAARDQCRLSRQFARLFALMLDGQARTLAQISEITGDPPASVSAQLRHMRKPRFGAHLVEREHLGRGLYRYTLTENTCPDLV